MRLAMAAVRFRRGLRSGMIRGQSGFMLIEVIVAVAILGVVAVGFLSALSSGYMALVLADENTVAESLTRTEFERIRQSSYPAAGYQRDNALPGYDVTVEVANVGGGDSPIQSVTVAVQHQGELVLTTSTYKVDPNRNL